MDWPSSRLQALPNDDRGTIVSSSSCQRNRLTGVETEYETVGILPLISRKTLGILGDGGTRLLPGCWTVTFFIAYSYKFCGCNYGGLVKACVA